MIIQTIQSMIISENDRINDYYRPCLGLTVLDKTT